MLASRITYGLRACVRARFNPIIAFVYKTLIRHESTTPLAMYSLYVHIIKILHAHAIRSKDKYSWIYTIVFSDSPNQLEIPRKKNLFSFFFVQEYITFYLFTYEIGSPLSKIFTYKIWSFVVEILYLHAIQNAIKFNSRDFFRLIKFKIFNLLLRFKIFFEYIYIIVLHRTY